MVETMAVSVQGESELAHRRTNGGREVVLNAHTKAFANESGGISVFQRRMNLVAGKGEVPPVWEGVTLGPNELWSLVRSVKRWHLHHKVQAVRDRNGSVQFHACLTCNLVLEDESR